MRTEKLSSVKRVMYFTMADKSNATNTSKMNTVHMPEKNRKDRKSMSLSLDEVKFNNID